MLMVRAIASCMVLLVLILAGCAGPATTAPTQEPTSAPTSVTQTTRPAETTTRPKGPYGELKIGLGTFGTEPLDPIKGIAGNALGILAAMMDSMLRLDGPKLVPGVVEKWEMSPDGQSWLYTVRKGVKFHNGDVLSGKDVKFSLERWALPEATTSTVRLAFDRAELIDDYTVRVYTKGPRPYFALYNSFYSPAQGLVMPKDYIEKNGIEYFKDHPIGSGSYKFARHIAGDMFEFEALTEHWRQVPEFKRLMTILVPEETTREAMFKTGGLDMVEVDLESANELEKEGYQVSNVALETPSLMLLGAYQPEGADYPTADIRVRQALSLAINRDEIIQTMFYGKAIPAAPAFVTDYNVTDVDLPYWLNYAKTVNRYDVDEARKLMKEAGFANGFSIKMITFTMTGSPYLPKLGEVLQGYWEKIGVKTELVPTDLATYTASYRNTLKTPRAIGQASIYSVSARPLTVQILQNHYYGSTDAQHALFGKAKPEIDKLIDAANSEVDVTKRKDIIAQVIKVVADNYVSPSIATIPFMAAVGPKVDVKLPTPALSLPIYADLAKHK